MDDDEVKYNNKELEGAPLVRTKSQKQRNGRAQRQVQRVEVTYKKLPGK